MNAGAETTSAAFTTSTLANGDNVSVQMTSNLSCAAAQGTATSNAIVMTVNPILIPTVTITASPTTICQNNSVTFTAVTTNGGNAPLYEWSINAVNQGPPSGSSTFTTTALTSSYDVVSVILTSNAACVSPFTARANTSITVNPGIGAGTIGTDQTVCYNTVPAAITQLTAATNIVGTPTYTWEVSLDGVSPWSAIPGSSGSGYTFPVPLTQGEYIRRIVTDPGSPAPCNLATSNVIHITVRPQLIAGIIAGDETICAGTVPSTMNQIAAPTGGMGTYTYQWESSVQSGGPYSNILNETNTTYNPDVLNVTTYFRRIETSGICGSVTTNEVVKEISNAQATISITDPGMTCDGDIIVFKCQATNVGLTPTYNWYVNNNIIFSLSTTPTDFHFDGPLKSGDEVYAELISSNTCANVGSVISNKIIVDLITCTVSNAIYTTSNIDILMQQYVSNSVPNLTDYTYFWSITDASITTSTITGPNPIIPGQQNAVYSVPNQTGFTYDWTISGGTIVSGQNTNSVTVNWDNATSPVARTASTTYSISVTETNQANKTNTTTLDINTVATGISKSLSQAGITLFPNPATDAFYIEMPQSGLNVAYDIIDVTGLSVANGTFTSSTIGQQIASDFGPGLYQVVLHYNNVVTVGRLSKVQ